MLKCGRRRLQLAQSVGRQVPNRDPLDDRCERPGADPGRADRVRQLDEPDSASAPARSTLPPLILSASPCGWGSSGPEGGRARFWCEMESLRKVLKAMNRDQRARFLLRYVVCLLGPGSSAAIRQARLQNARQDKPNPDQSAEACEADRHSRGLRIWKSASKLPNSLLWDSRPETGFRPTSPTCTRKTFSNFSSNRGDSPHRVQVRKMSLKTQFGNIPRLTFSFTLLQSSRRHF